jgi:hypothetical protein
VHLVSHLDSGEEILVCKFSFIHIHFSDVLQQCNEKAGLKRPSQHFVLYALASLRTVATTAASFYATHDGISAHGREERVRHGPLP